MSLLLFTRDKLSSKRAKKILTRTAALLLFFSCLGSTLIYHESVRQEKWKNEINADAAGYHAYLCTWFDYGTKASSFPKNFDQANGGGFQLDTVNNAIRIKYPCGVALLQTPFYLANKLGGKFFNYDASPYSDSDARSVSVAANFYLAAGFLFLVLFLSNFFSLFTSFVSVVLLIFSTNVIYYSTFCPGMSHIYSFFLFSFYLFIGYKLLEKRKNSYLILLGLTAGLIVATRPLNIFFLLSLFFIHGTFLESIRFFLNIKKILLLFCTAFLVFLPQFLFWKTVYGKFIYYSYEGEGFPNLLHPKFSELFFSAMSGLFTYNPVYFILFPLLVFLVFKKNRYAVFFFCFVSLISYLYASWHDVTFGCGYGCRNFVEIAAGFAFPLAFVLDKVFKSKKVYFILPVAALLAGGLALNVILLSRFDLCFYGNGIWDWREYEHYLYDKENKYFTGFENVGEPNAVKSDSAFAGQGIALVDQNTNVFIPMDFKDKEVPTVLRKITVSFMIYVCDSVSGSMLGADIFEKDTSIYKEFIELEKFNLTPKKWEKVEWSKDVIMRKEDSAGFHIFFLNFRKHRYFFDNFEVKIK